MFRFLTIVLVFTSIIGFGQDIPKQPSPPRLVNDFVGGLISEAQKQALEQKLVAYNDSTSTQVTVVIVKSVEPYDIGDYAIKLGREWGVGQKKKNNGIVLLWAPGDRKITIQTGYGMEGVLPDMYAKRIISDVIGPNFKQLKYYEGLDLGTTEIFKYASGEYKADPEDEGSWIGFIILLLIVFFIIWILYKIGKGMKNGGGGGGLASNPAPFTIFSGWGTQTGGWSSGGGSGWSSGGSSGGGFGGFGGGSFGGGGASGDY